MKILFINRPKSAWIGGDYIQMEKTAEALRNLGVEVEISETPLITPAIRMKEFDIIHTWNFSMTWSKFAIWCAGKWKRKIVASMIYHEGEQFICYPHQQIMLDHTDAAIFLSNTEIDRVKRHLKIRENQIHIIPNGIDPIFFRHEENIIKQDKVLTVGRIEPSKGQLAVAKACKQLDIPYICIGQIIDKKYAQLLRKQETLIITSLKQEDLIPYYAEHGIFALVSQAEIFPLTVMEAMAQNCKIIITKNSEWIPNGAEVCEYDNIKEIKKAILKSLKKPIDYKMKDQLKGMTWDKVGEQILEVYKQILK